MRIKWDALHVQIMAVKAAHPEWTNKQVGAAVGVERDGVPVHREAGAVRCVSARE